MIHFHNCLHTFLHLEIKKEEQSMLILTNWHQSLTHWTLHFTIAVLHSCNTTTFHQAEIVNDDGSRFGITRNVVIHHHATPSTTTSSNCLMKCDGTRRNVAICIHWLYCCHIFKLHHGGTFFSFFP